MEPVEDQVAGAEAETTPGAINNVAAIRIAIFSFNAHLFPTFQL
jgi:hypothetical protein